MAKADFDAGREGIIRRLGHVDMVVRRYDAIRAARFSQQVQCPVGQDFIHVHIDGSPGTALDRIDGELIHPLSGDDLIGSSDNRCRNLRIQPPGLLIRQRCCLLHFGNRRDELMIQMLSRDLKVIQSP